MFRTFYFVIIAFVTAPICPARPMDYVLFLAIDNRYPIAFKFVGKLGDDEMVTLKSVLKAVEPQRSIDQTPAVAKLSKFDGELSVSVVPESIPAECRLLARIFPGDTNLIRLLDKLSKGAQAAVREGGILGIAALDLETKLGEGSEITGIEYIYLYTKYLETLPSASVYEAITSNRLALSAGKQFDVGYFIALIKRGPGNTQEYTVAALFSEEDRQQLYKYLNSTVGVPGLTHLDRVTDVVDDNVLFDNPQFLLADCLKLMRDMSEDQPKLIVKLAIACRLAIATGTRVEVAPATHEYVGQRVVLGRGGDR